MAVPQTILDALDKLQADADALATARTDAATKAQAATDAAAASTAAAAVVTSAGQHVATDLAALIALEQSTYAN